MVETDVHFPTDINLLWDSGRKCLDMIEKLLEEKYAGKDGDKARVGIRN